MAVVLQEITQDKIFLDSSKEVRVTGEMPEGGGSPELDLNDL